ncbi:hypothetical protein [Aquimarina aggregata]|uniref:hypothetical protein n=1 Tax=Aquimarina aggregata TaxID=1642818 RepID=UPI00249109F4|nr:hypothetical protein [Aquimarina aggregata]
MELSKNPKVNTKIYGEFKYNSYLDTINLKGDDYRSIRLYLGIFKKEHSIKELKSIKLDTFISLNENDRNIPFYLKFEEKGDFVVDGYVEDVVFLNNYKNGGTRILTNETKVIGNVKVVDN